MKRNKKGSSMITVIIVMMVLTIVGTSLISLTFSGYRARVGESNRLENLYGAESGLDLSYNIIANVMEAGIRSGEYAVEHRANRNANYDECNVIFKSAVGDFINASLENCIENKEWINPDNTHTPDLDVRNDKGDFNVEATVSGNIARLTDGTEYYSDFDVTLRSTFTCANQNGEGNDVERQIEARYRVNVPDYLKIEYETISKTKNYNYNQVIAVDGDMRLNGEVDINGDIYAKGKVPSSNSKDTKYNGGISVGDYSNVTISNGKVVTPRTVQVNTNGGLTAEDIYAGNVNIGKLTSNDSDCINGEIIAGDLWVRNDVAINSLNATVNLDNFYGINDYFTVSKDKGNVETAISRGNEDLSSSILINENNANINIDNEAYIWGTAYVNNYQTGESVAIKGNYKAYSYDVYGNDSGKKVSRKYDEESGTQFIYKIDNKDVTVMNKADYIKDYDKLAEKEGSKVSKLNKIGSINLPDNTYAIATYIDQGTLKLDSKLEKLSEAQNVVNIKQEDYAEEVFGMGNYQWKENEDKRSVFANGEIKKSVAREGQRDGIVDFTNISDEENQNRTVKIKTATKIEETEHVVVNNNREKTVVILGNGAKNNYEDDDYIVINSKDINGLIITEGDVVVAGEVNFKGLILAKGSFKTVDDSRSKVFISSIYNVERILKKANISEEIFKIPGGVQENITVNENMKSNKPYRIKDSIQKRLWKIIR